MIKYFLQDIGLLNFWWNDLTSRCQDYPQHIFILYWHLFFSLIVFCRNKNIILSFFLLIISTCIISEQFNDCAYNTSEEVIIKIVSSITGIVYGILFIKLSEGRLVFNRSVDIESILFSIVLYMSFIGSTEIIVESSFNIGILRTWIIISAFFFIYFLKRFDAGVVTRYWNSNIYNMWISSFFWYSSTTLAFMFHFLFIPSKYSITIECLQFYISIISVFALHMVIMFSMDIRYYSGLVNDKYNNCVSIYNSDSPINNVSIISSRITQSELSINSECKNRK